MVSILVVKIKLDFEAAATRAGRKILPDTTVSGYNYIRLVNLLGDKYKTLDRA